MNGLLNGKWVSLLAHLSQLMKYFSRKIKTVPHPSITFNNNPLSLCLAQKHLGLVLDSKLTFNKHINNVLSKVNKSTVLMRKFQSVLPRSSLLTIYKSFTRSHLDYADVVYHQSYKLPFYEKLESIQYNAKQHCIGCSRCCKRIFFWKNLPGVRIRVSLEWTMVQKTLPVT